jgi:hypothetical protein
VRRFSVVSLGVASRAGDLAVDEGAEVISSSSEVDDGDDENFSGVAALEVFNLGEFLRGALARGDGALGTTRRHCE